ncbi:hypothetical protein SAMN05421858_3695 [Haladaptatus litoreus]|uniref:Pectate lyase superfamily protein n=1 Tax=Haladaptatus litoreus TaxID=553468 RepID=A0A1N7DKM8_9EURY|nr:hypothetical protein [Haladaptatus litoreus]SIR76295.1 hypothetical protein SAMN05421858_3695 [Haladaptatus litoreus]
MPTYNIVDEGADNSGNSAIDPTLYNLIEDDTTIIFPPGTYLLNELVVYSGIDNLHLIAPNGARLIPGQSGDSIRWFDVYSNGFVLDGFELDMRETEIPPFVRMNNEAGNWELKRLVTRGKVRAATDSNIGSGNSSDARTYFRLSAADGTRGLLQDCYFHEGACEPTEASNRRAILVESGKGELVFNRCWFELWGENTIYAKKPEGPLKIYNCFWRNTQVGVRIGGRTEVRNCVSIKDDIHPVQSWSGGSLQRGVSVEGVVPADPENGINSYEGTATIADSDFYHRYPDSSCGGPITASAPCEEININNVRISYNSEKYHDAIYTLNGRMNNGDDANLEYLKIKNTEVHNDHDYQYAVSIGQEPNEWGDVAGVLGGSGPQTDSSYIQNQMTTNGDPTPPDTRPPLPSAPPLGEVPLQSAQLVRIDNTGNDSVASYQITGGTYVLPAGDNGATVAMDWGPNGSPVRPPDSEQASGSVPPGEVYAFYVTGGIVSTGASGSATWTIDGTPFSPGNVLSTDTLSADQASQEQWHQVEASDQSTGVVVANPPSYNGAQPLHVRLRNTIAGGFDYKLEEWDYLDGAHTTETFNTLAVPPAEYNLQLDNDLPYRVKAGTASTDHNRTTVSLGDFFGGIRPVILAQSQSFNGRDPIVTRVSSVSSDSFEVQVQEEGNGTHRVETVGYIALQPEIGFLDGKPFEVRRTAQGVTDEWTRIEFQRPYENPQFVASLQTLHGLDTAGLRYRNLTSTGVEVKVEEEQSSSSETNHAEEAIGYAVFGNPLLTSTISNTQSRRHEWHQVDSIVQPDGVVIAKPLSYNGTQPIHVRLQNVSDGSMEYKLEEWRYQDGEHLEETFHTLSMKEGEREVQLDDGASYRMKAGTAGVADSFESISLGNFFGTETPIVLTQSQTFNGGDPIVTRLRNVSSGSFDVRVQEEQASDGTHPNDETVGYIALEQTTAQINDTLFEVQRAEGVTNEWSQITFEQAYDTPQFVADMQTIRGPDTANLRYRNLTSTGVEVKIEEEQSADFERAHTSEVVGYVVVEDSV